VGNVFFPKITWSISEEEKEMKNGPQALTLALPLKREMREEVRRLIRVFRLTLKNSKVCGPFPKKTTHFLEKLPTFLEKLPTFQEKYPLF